MIRKSGVSFIGGVFYGVILLGSVYIFSFSKNNEAAGELSWTLLKGFSFGPFFFLGPFCILAYGFYAALLSELNKGTFFKLLAFHFFGALIYFLIFLDFKNFYLAQLIFNFRIFWVLLLIVLFWTFYYFLAVRAPRRRKF